MKIKIVLASIVICLFCAVQSYGMNTEKKIVDENLNKQKEKKIFQSIVKKTKIELNNKKEVQEFRSMEEAFEAMERNVVASVPGENNVFKGKTEINGQTVTIEFRNVFKINDDDWIE